jgi:hypothetical protein
VPESVPASTSNSPHSTPRHPMTQSINPQNYYTYRGVVNRISFYKTTALPIELRQPRPAAILAQFPGCFDVVVSLHQAH